MASSTTATPSKLEAQLTGKARQLEEEHAKGMSEAERLREEVNRTRALRANRQANRSQKSISSMSGIVSPSSPLTSPPLGSGTSAAASASTSPQPDLSLHTMHVEPNTKVKHHASSYPVFTGRVASSNTSSSSRSPGPTSLANFIGGDMKIKGPVLNKVRPFEEESLLSPEERSTPQATFLARNPGLLPGHAGSGRTSPAVALPGMVRATPSPSASTYTPSKSPEPPRNEKSVTDPTPISGSKSPLLGFGSSIKPSYDRTLSKSPAPMDKLSLSDKPTEENTSSQFTSRATISKPYIASPKPIQAFGTPSLQDKSEDSRGTQSTSTTEDTTSLGRLKGASIVKQRLAWGEAQKETSNSPASKYTPTNSPKPTSSYGLKTSPELTKASTPVIAAMETSKSDPAKVDTSTPTGTPIQHKRSSVLDRWNRDTPDAKGNGSTPASAVKSDSQASKWPKPSYSKPALANKPSWSSTSAASPSAETPTDTVDVENAAGETPQAQESLNHGVSSPENTRLPVEKSAEELKAFQRPSTKPPWMSKEADSSTSKSSEPVRASSFPRPHIVTSNLSAGSPAPSPKPSPKPSRSMPSPSLPISVSPTPYVRSGVSPGVGGATSPRNSVFQPSATSFPVSLGVAPTHARPLSLAHFIGGDRQVNGPVLNKVRPEDSDSYGLETDASSGGPNVRVGTFLTHNPAVLGEMMKKQRVAMPGMVRAQAAAATSPVATSSEHKAEIVEAPEIERKISSGPLPLPGMESPKLPLPGQEGFSPPFQAEDRAKNEAREQETNGDPTMSRLLSSGYQTVHSLDTVQPSESDTLHSGEISRPSARTLSHEFEKRNHNSSAVKAPSPGSPVTPKSAAPLSSGSEDNPWAAIGSAMLEPAQNAPQDQSNHRSKPSWEGTLKTLGKGPARHAPRPPSRQNSQEVPRMASDPIVARKTAIRAGDLPSINVSKAMLPSTSQLTFQQYVSVEVLSITDNSKITAVPSQEHHIFYSTELLAVVLRSKQGGLVTTDIIVWKGKHCSEDGSAKVEELESRYRTTAQHVEQGRESLQLVKALGGRLITRQGFRETFDVLNSTLYRVQSRGRGLAFIDEVELQASSLCSAYSYIASVFQDLFVWYGRGTPDEESRVALQYAEELAKATPGPKRKVAHMLEGAESDLWKDIMGHEEEYAFANHWRFRLDNPAISQTVPQFYEVSESNPAAAVRWLGDETACSLSDGSVYILRTPVECFVLVTPSARGNGKSIALHMQAALNMLKTNPLPGVPFRPTLHALILPSLIPKDLQAAMRSSHLEDLNSPHQPSTMNVIHEQTAWEHLGRNSFNKSEIQDNALLPLGVSPDMLQ